MRVSCWAIIAVFFALFLAPGARAQCSYVGPATASAPRSDGLVSVRVGLEFSQTAATGEGPCDFNDLSSCEGDSATCGHFYGCLISRVLTGPSSWKGTGVCLFLPNRTCAPINYAFRLSPTSAADITIRNSACSAEPRQWVNRAIQIVLEQLQ
jgi:hypothetical protein